MISIWLLTNAPSPYQVELLNAAHPRDDLALDVQFLRDSTTAGPDRRFPFRVHRAWLALSRGDELRFHVRVVWQAFFGQHDFFVLSGLYTSITFLCCAAILHCRNKPWVVWWERPNTQVHTRSGLWGWLLQVKDSVREWLLRRSWGVIGIGSAATTAYAGLGAQRDRLHCLPYCCDISRFEQAAASRPELAIGAALRFLFSGQLIPRKGVDTLLQAFASLAEEYPQITLRLLGAGSEQDTLQTMVPEDLRQRITFAGLVSQADLPREFAQADVFVFPSRHDGWAVVINEACGASLPIIATRQTGAAADLVRDRESGFVIEADDVNALTGAMQWFIDHPDSIRSMGRRSRELVEPWTAENGAAQLSRIAREVLDLPRRVQAQG